jgi:hypothetical protein
VCVCVTLCVLCVAAVGEDDRQRYWCASVGGATDGGPQDLYVWPPVPGHCAGSQQVCTLEKKSGIWRSGQSGGWARRRLRSENVTLTICHCYIGHKLSNILRPNSEELSVTLDTSLAPF